MTPVTALATTAIVLAALLVPILFLQRLRRQLHAARTEASDLRRRMRRVTVAAMVAQGVSEARVQQLLGRDRPITVEEVAELLDREKAA